MFFQKGVRLLILSNELANFLRRCLNEHIGPYREIHLPVMPADQDSPHSILAPLREKTRPALDGHRAIDPAKLLLYGARERVAPFSAEPAAGLLAGVKACDIKALEILDRALINGVKVFSIMHHRPDMNLAMSAVLNLQSSQNKGDAVVPTVV
jgi:hypothetical protein